ncbi:patatin-like phospholipase family protein [Actinomadura flavalba]|uniref:patatin-like phospholipase family protein n=1 Tax=Actinomadura flavalba TaxID=1120938 RepID=UPI00036DFD9C|nr:patatin-like phospholipase family protein [Actinomadura flavalba]
MTSALVLGGGGVAGIAWQIGVLAGLADAGRDATGADLVVGTSAGAAVAAQLGAGLSLEALFARQADPALQTPEEVPSGPVGVVLETMLRLVGEISDPAERRRAVAEFALDAPTPPEETRRKVIEARLPSHDWPDRDVRITAVEASAGTPVVFDRASGVSLVDAVTASCAVPGVWPPATIGDARYIDGGVRSLVNADLAEGHDRVLILAPSADPALDEQIAALTGTVELITPDEASLAAFGPDPLAPSTRTPAAEAGRAQGRTHT